MVRSGSQPTSFAGPLSGTMVSHVHELLGHAACCMVTLIHGNRSSSAIQCGLRTWGVLIKTHKLVKMTQATAFHTTASTLRKCSSLPHDPGTLTTQNGKASALQELLGSPVMVSSNQSRGEMHASVFSECSGSLCQQQTSC